MISIHTQLHRLPTALQGMHLTYRHWLNWQHLTHPVSKRYALKAKTFGLITYDRIMTMDNRGNRG